MRFKHQPTMYDKMLQSVFSRKHSIEDESWVFATITSSTNLASPQTKYMWEYQIAEAQFDHTGGGYPTISGRSGGITATAYSISELGNSTTTFSYGVNLSGITQFTGSTPPLIAPQPIPNGTPVLAFPWRKTDGTFIYLIVNTQAISGTCE